MTSEQDHKIVHKGRKADNDGSYTSPFIIPESTGFSTETKFEATLIKGPVDKHPGQDAADRGVINPDDDMEDF